MRNPRMVSRACRPIWRTSTSGSCITPPKPRRPDVLREIFRFELRQQLRSPLFWLIAFALAALAFAAACSDSITIGGGVGNVHRNAPMVVISTRGFCSPLGFLLIMICVVGAALRDPGLDPA